MKYYAMLLAAVSLSVTGELLLKHGMNQVGVLSLHPDNIVAGLWRSFTSPFVLLGFAAVFGGSIFWLSIISRVQLSYAYPMLSLSYVIVLLASWLLLNEQFSPVRVLGVLIVCLGVFVVSRT
ncbi:MAG: EamA family transporter [Chloroflexi bacterium]|nr:EamA family transporter [Chloroflexota bacterium]MDA8189506.1 EamA family transporter [Dehalococcoidales bacterium]